MAPGRGESAVRKRLSVLESHDSNLHQGMRQGVHDLMRPFVHKVMRSIVHEPARYCIDEVTRLHNAQMLPITSAEQQWKPVTEQGAACRCADPDCVCRRVLSYIETYVAEKKRKREAAGG